MQLYGGRFGFCDEELFNPFSDDCGPYDGCFRVADAAECSTINGSVWMNPHYGHFDHIVSSVVVLFEMSTLERWPDVFFYSGNAARTLYPSVKSPFRQPDGPSLMTCVYWIGWIFFSAFIIMNLVIGVVVESFQRMRERSDGTVFLSEKQRAWVEVMTHVTARKALKMARPPKGRLRFLLFNLVQHKYFDICILLIIFLNVLVLATDMADYLKSDIHDQILRVTGILFSIVFFIEFILKILGLGIKQYFQSRWNCFDFILVMSSIADTVFTFTPSSLPFNPIAIRMLRLLRTARIVRLVRTFKSIVHMLRTLILSLPALFNVFCLLVLLMYIYAVVGVYAFWDVNPMSARFLDDRYVNFKEFGTAVLTLFRCVTGESWNGIMHDLMINDFTNPRQCVPPHKCGNPAIAVIYFVSYTILANFMLLNLVIAVILQNFSGYSADAEQVITVDKLESFQEEWQVFDAEGTNRMPAEQLPFLLASLKVHTWIYNYDAKVPFSWNQTLKLARKLEVPEHSGIIHFQECLQAIARAVHHRFKMEAQREITMLDSDRVPFDEEDSRKHDAQERIRLKLEKKRRRAYKRGGLDSLRVEAHVVRSSWASLIIQEYVKRFRMQRYLRGQPEHLHDIPHRQQLVLMEIIHSMRIARAHGKRTLPKPKGYEDLISHVAAAPHFPLFVPGQGLVSASVHTSGRMSSRRAAQIIQASYTSRLESRYLNFVRQIVVFLQSHFRMRAQRREFLRVRGSALIVSKACHKWLQGRRLAARELRRINRSTLHL